VLTDLGSANGTFVDGQRLEGSRELDGGEEIRIGANSLRATVPEPEPPAAAASQPERPAPAPRRRRQTTIMKALERRMRRTTLLAVAAVLLALAVAGVAFSGVLSEGGEGGDPAPTTQDIVRAVTPSTVLVTSGLDGSPTGSGSGWVLDAGEGLVVTNAHVVNLQPDAGTSSFEITADGRSRPAEVVGVAPCEDLALLRVSDTEGLRTLPLGSQAELEQGETVVAAGFPETASTEPNLVATRGVVSVVESRADAATGTGVVALPNVVQTDAAINPGNSGGPLVDERKRLVGINTLGNTQAENQGYAIGVDRAREVLETLRRGESIAWTGAAFTPLSDASSGEGDGLLLAAAAPGTAAADGGLGDELKLLQAVNGRQIEPSVAGYCEAIGDAGSGEQVSLTVQDVSRTSSGDYALQGAAPEEIEVTLE
jgi:S1-C subfamily serine protease